MLVRRVLRRFCSVAVVASAGLLVGCGPSTTAAGGEGNGESVPSNVTIQESDPTPPRLPANLAATSGQLGDLVDFHDEDFSGSWYDSSDETLHIGVVTPTGRALLDRSGLRNDPAVVVESAGRSLADGQRLVDSYVRRSALGESVVGWGALAHGDGIELSIEGDHLTSEQLDELGDLPVRVVVTLGQSAPSLD